MPGIEVHHVTEDDPVALDALVAVRAVTDREINPDDPPAPRAEVAAELFVASTSARREGWVARVDGAPAGELVLSLEQTVENGHMVDVESLAVAPDHRRLGVADALLREGLRWAAADGRTSVVLWVPVLPGGGGEGYAERLGGTMRLAERCSRLSVADVDAGQQEAWLRDGRERTDGYGIVQWVGSLPEEHVGALAAAHRAMEDMPIDELDWAIPPMTPDRLRSRAESWQRAGLRSVTTLALAPDGSAVGLSELVLNTHRPQLADQGDTGVVAAHRGRGLGRWLKAENLRLALDTEPRLEVVETYNAASNPWMLDINVAMGFRPHIDYHAFQGEVADALAVLG